MTQYVLSGIILAFLAIIFYQYFAPLSPEKEQAVLDVIRSNSGLHGTEIARRAKFSTSEVYRYLRILESKRLIQVSRKNVSGLEISVYKIM